MSEQVPAWISLPITDERVETLRESLFAAVDAPETYSEITSPHVTIHPGFTTTPEGIDALRDYLDARETIPVPEVVSVYAFPSINDPMVISLGIDIDLNDTRADIGTILAAHDGSVIFDPVPAHVTLFKSRGEDGTIEETWDGIDAEAHDRLRDAMKTADIPTGTLSVERPHVDTQDPPAVPSDEPGE